MTGPAGLADSFGRVMRDLRVSVTDRCNFRCLYCLPETEAAANFYRTRFDPRKNPHPAALHRTIVHAWKPRDALLRFEEIERAVRIAVALGLRKVRLTGGEPLLRQGFEQLVARLAALPGLEDLAMTTNGFLFRAKARALRDAGLRRVSFSLDSLEPDNFRRLTGRDGLPEVLTAIRLARDLGFAPVKVNAVIIRGLNDHELEALVDWAGAEGVTLRFIEFMPLDSGRAWQRDHVVPGREILDRLRARHALLPVAPADPAETARRWRIPGGPEIGIIAPVSEPFCGHCNRLRLTADGQVRTCLFSLGEHDLKARLRDGSDDAALAAWLCGVVWQKEDRHHIGEPGFAPPERSMSCIGG